MKIEIEQERGAETIRAMERQMECVEQAWGTIRPEWAAKTSLSLARQLARLLHSGFGDCTVCRDGDLSLYVHTQSIVFGVIFHRTHRPPMPLESDGKVGVAGPMMGRYCMADVGGEARYCATAYQGYDGGKPGCEGHEPEPFAMPVPGEWSFHS